MRRIDMATLPIWRKSFPIRHQQNPLVKMQTALDKIMEDFYHDFDLPSFPTKEFENLMISPAIDIINDEKQFKVEAEMPGMGEEDIQIAINEGMLTIKGEKETSKQDKDKNYSMREINYGSYERTIRLPDSVDIDKAKASFKKGMLWVEIPKKADAATQSRKLKVEKA